MGNLSANKPAQTFCVYRDKYDLVKTAPTADIAKQYSKNGKYATVLLPVDESFSDYEEKIIIKAFGELECLK